MTTQIKQSVSPDDDGTRARVRNNEPRVVLDSPFAAIRVGPFSQFAGPTVVRNLTRQTRRALVSFIYPLGFFRTSRLVQVFSDVFTDTAFGSVAARVSPMIAGRPPPRSFAVRATAITCLGHSAVQSRLKCPVVYCARRRRRRQVKVINIFESNNNVGGGGGGGVYVFVCTKSDYTRIIIPSEQRKTNPECTHSRFSARCLHIVFYSVLLDRRLTKLPKTN